MKESYMYSALVNFMFSDPNIVSNEIDT